MLSIRAQAFIQEIRLNNRMQTKKDIKKQREDYRRMEWRTPEVSFT
jgi:hypothetical protein